MRHPTLSVHTVFRNEVAKKLIGYSAQVETLLKTQDPPESTKGSAAEVPPARTPLNPNGPFQGVPDLSSLADEMVDVTVPFNDNFGDVQQDQPMGDPSLGITEDFSWEMIGLGLEEPLPNQDVVEELYVPLLALFFIPRSTWGSLSNRTLPDTKSTSKRFTRLSLSYIVHDTLQR